MIIGVPRVAVVAPFFGRDLRGDNERFVFSLVTHLALEGVAVEVITTTARDEAPGENFYRTGIDYTEPFPVHRFRVAAPDRVAYTAAVLAVEGDQARVPEHERAFVDERVRSPEIVAHLRAVGGTFAAFIFVDIAAATTVYGLPEVAEKALVVPLMGAGVVARLPAVGETLRAARQVLCTCEPEAALVKEVAGGDLHGRVNVIGLAAESVAREEIHAMLLDTAARHQPYVLLSGHADGLANALASLNVRVVGLHKVDERDRAAYVACALAMIITEPAASVAAVAEAWSYGKPVVLLSGSVASSLVARAKGGAVVESVDDVSGLLAGTPEETLTAWGEAGASFIRDAGGWPRVARRTSEAVDAMAALDDGRSREALLEQIAYLYPLVQRQRRTIDAMRVSRFWRLRNLWFRNKQRLGIGPAEDPIRELTADERGAELAAIGDHYQLFREKHRLRPEDVARMRASLRFFPRLIEFGLLIDADGADPEDLRATLASVRAQIYPHWTVRIRSNGDRDALARALLAEGSGNSITIVTAGADRHGNAQFLAPLDPGDTIEPHALFECALVLQDDDADVIYSDEDRFDERGIPGDVWFKPDWSPETLLTRNYVGRLLIVRASDIAAVGGVRDVFETASWYDTVLRITERTERVHHIPQVLYHRGLRNRERAADLALAAEAALARRREKAAVTLGKFGTQVSFGNAGERICVIIPTRDRSDLLGRCLGSVFDVTAYSAYEVVVVDNGSREAATFELFEHWQKEQRDRFRIIRDPAPFNYSRLNNRAARATDAAFLLMLNNDTEVIAPDWMDAMLGQARRPAIGAVGAMLLYDDDTVQHGGVLVGILGLAGHAHRYLPASSPGYHGALALDTNYSAVTAACLMVAHEKFDLVGGFDEALAVSSNDVDFCLKLLAAGYRNVYVPRARLRHHESRTRGGDNTPAKVARTQHEIGLIRSRWPVWSSNDPYYNPNLTVDAEDFDVRL